MNGNESDKIWLLRLVKKQEEYMTSDEKKIGEWKMDHKSGKYKSQFNFANDLLEGEIK